MLAPASLASSESFEVPSGPGTKRTAASRLYPEQVVAAYLEWSEKGVAALAALQEPPMADTMVPLSDLGSHPCICSATRSCSITLVTFATTSVLPSTVPRASRTDGALDRTRLRVVGHQARRLARYGDR